MDHSCGVTPTETQYYCCNGPKMQLSFWLSFCVNKATRQVGKGLSHASGSYSTILVCWCWCQHPQHGETSRTSASRVVENGRRPNSLVPRRAGLERALLEAVGAGAVSSPADVQHFLRCTFMFHLMDYAQVHKAAKAALVCVLRPSREFPVSRPVLNGSTSRSGTYDLTDTRRDCTSRERWGEVRMV